MIQFYWEWQRKFVSAVAATNDVSVSKNSNVFFNLSSCWEVQNLFRKTYDPVLQFGYFT